MDENESSEVIHVLDLPQLYTKPTAASLTSALNLLTTQPTTFVTGSTSSSPISHRPTVSASTNEITSYLTSIIASQLPWLPNNVADEIHELASQRLAERAGRTAMSSLTRTFVIPSSTSADDDFQIHLHEPALTGDNLGHKTWSSSFVLACKLHKISSSSDSEMSTTREDLALELGSGTGLLGLAYASLYPHAQTLLTDLPEIVPNLQRNIELNVPSQHKRPVCGVLDWTTPMDFKAHQPARPGAGREAQQQWRPMNKPLLARTILVADPIYSPSHPDLLVNAILTHLARDNADDEVRSKVLLAYPVRTAYAPQIEDLRRLLEQNGLEAVQQGTEWAKDDWTEEVRVDWGVWMWRKR